MRRVLFCWALSFLMATPSQLSAQPKRNPPSSVNKAQACGPISDGALKCPRFGFNYKVPFGWVDRTDEMQDGGVSDTESTSKSEAEKPASSRSQTLLAIFERPPAAPGETINSAVVIAAESVADYHAVKQASDYFGPITELAEQRGFKTVNGPYTFSVSGKQLVRGDFSKERGKLTMWQTSLVIIEKGYIVSFTLMAGSGDDVEQLTANLSFATRSQPHK
jgi:hypothetical protein